MKKPTYKGKELLPLSVIDAARDGDSQAVEQVLLLGKQELPVSNTAVTLPACNQVAVVCLFGILYIIDNGFDGGSNSPSLADVQRHQPCGCHTAIIHHLFS